MRILLANKFHYNRGGSETYYFGLADILKKKGHEVAFFSMKHPQNVPCEYEQYFVENVDYNQSGGNKIKAGIKALYSLEARHKIAKLMRAFNPDIVHINNFHRQLSVSIIDEVKKQKAPLVYTAHDYTPACPAISMLRQGENCGECAGGKFHACIRHSCVKGSKAASVLGALEAYLIQMKKAYRKIDAVITPSAFLRDKLVQSGITHPDYHVIYNMLDTMQIPDLSEKADQRTFLYLGRFAKEKGVITLLKAVKTVPGAVLRLAGTGPVEKEIQTFIRENMLENRVTLLGHLTKERVMEEFGRAAAAVIPSEWYENCPYAVLEAMCAGKTVIGSKIGGIPELLRQGETGLLFEPANVEDLAAQMRLVIEDPERAKKIGKNARNQAIHQYDQESYYIRIMEVYQKLLERS